MEAFFVVVMAVAVLGVGVAALTALRTIEAVPVPDPSPRPVRERGPRPTSLARRWRAKRLVGARDDSEASDDAEPTVEIAIPASWRKSR